MKKIGRKMTIIEGLTQIEQDILDVIIKSQKANNHRVPVGFSHILPYNELGTSKVDPNVKTIFC